MSDAWWTQRIAEAAACLWLVFAFWVMRQVNRRIARLEASVGQDKVGMFGDIVPLGYALTLSAAWPVSVALALFWLRSPALARQARITVFAVLAFFTMQVLVWSWNIWSWAG